MRILKQSTAASVMVFMTDSTDHISGKASLTLTITASKNGAAFGSISPTVNDRGSGWYELQLTTSHTDTLGDLALHITSTGADPSDLVCYVVVRHLADLAWPATSGRSMTVESDGMVYADAREWMGSAPNALQSGRVDAYGGALAANVITSTAINAGAIASGKIGAGAITSTEATSVGNVTGDVQGKVLGGGASAMTAAGVRAVDGSGNAVAPASATTDIQARLPAALVSGRIDASVGAMASGVLTAAAIDANAINAAKLDPDVTTELQAGLATTIQLTDVHDTVDDIHNDVGSISGRIPAALISGRIDATVGAMQNDVVTAASIAAGAITSSEAPALANLDATVSSRAVAGDSMALTSAAVDAVLDEVVEGSMTFRQMLRIFLSALALKSAGGGTTTISFRDQSDSKNRISVTVDSNNNRTAIGTLDGT